MAIFVQCGCGKDFYVPEERAGKRFKCYLCNRDLVARASEQSLPETITTRPAPDAPATSPPTADPMLTGLLLRRDQQRDTALFRRGFGMGFMVSGVLVAFLGGLIALSDRGDALSGIGTVLFTTGGLFFLLGFGQWLRWRT